MQTILWILQGIVFLFISEQFLRKNKNWDMVFLYLEKGAGSFLTWRANANITKEMQIIPDLFSKIGLTAFFIMFLLPIFKINHLFLVHSLLIIIALSLTIVFSFNWVFKHKETIKEFKPVMYIYGLFALVIVS